MKKLLIILQLLFTIIAITSCNKNDETEKYDENPNYYLFEGYLGLNDVSTVVSIDNSLLMCGNSSSKNFILKINKSGTQFWKKDLVKGTIGNLYSLVQSSSGDIFIFGSVFQDNTTSKTDALLIKTNANGDILWSKKYGGLDYELGVNIKETKDGNILIAGHRFNYNLSQYIFLLKINYDGDTLWTKNFSDHNMKDVYSIIETVDGSYLIISSRKEDNIYKFSRHYLKLNTSGEQIWYNIFTDTIQKLIYSTIELSNGDLISTGTIRYDMYEDRQILVIKTDKLGNIIWEKDFGEVEFSENGGSIKQNLDGGFTITGRSDQYARKCDIILLKIDSNGNEIWYKRFGSSNVDNGKNVIIDSNDDIIITGEYNVDNSTPYDGDIFMTKTDKNGNFK